MSNLSATFDVVESITISNFNVCYYEDDIAYIQFNCFPFAMDSVSAFKKISDVVAEAFGLKLGEITYAEGEEMQISIEGEHTLEELRAIGIPVSDES